MPSGDVCRASGRRDCILGAGGTVILRSFRIVAVVGLWGGPGGLFTFQEKLVAVGEHRQLCRWRGVGPAGISNASTIHPAPPQERPTGAWCSVCLARILVHQAVLRRTAVPGPAPPRLQPTQPHSPFGRGTVQRNLPSSSST